MLMIYMHIHNHDLGRWRVRGQARTRGMSIDFRVTGEDMSIDLRETGEDMHLTIHL